MEEFYRSILDLAPEPSLNSARDTTQGFAAGNDRAQITRPIVPRRRRAPAARRS